MEQVLRMGNAIISFLFFLCYFYQFVYIPLALRREKAPVKPPKPNRYAVLIAARNESAVIGDLLDSLARQTYNRSLVKVFVIADNCTDATAAIARSRGTTVYERFNRDFVGKGYALDELLQHIRGDYPAGFDGYFVFDADNILEPDYIERMNETFSQGHEIVTSYRNSKNFGANWVSSGYALWFLRESRFLNGARMRLGTSCAVSGTGFLFSQGVIDETGGWHFYLLTEDIQFSVHHILRGRRIAFCPRAVLYDEQPTSFRQSCRQRLRWAKGYLQVFRHYGADLLRGVLRGSWSCFDMAMNIMPAFMLSAAGILLNTVSAGIGLWQGLGVWFAVRSLLECLGSMLLTLFVLGVITTVSEWRQIRTTPLRKVLATVSFPFFMFTYLPVSIAAVFMPVEWKPITHSVTAAQMRELNKI